MYSPQFPRGKDNTPKIGYPPAKVARVSTNKENASASSILLLGHNTTEIEVGAIGQGIALKWLTQANVDNSVAGTSVITAAGSANFDNLIESGTIRRFVVPQATIPQTQSVMGINREKGLYPAVAFKTLAGNGSVLTGEF